jgi:hypothetical protein
MPNNIRAILSVVVALATLLVFILERQAGDGTLQWVALGLGVFMVAAVWLFPEAKGVKDN